MSSYLPPKLPTFVPYKVVWSAKKEGLEDVMYFSSDSAAKEEAEFLARVYGVSVVSMTKE